MRKIIMLLTLGILATSPLFVNGDFQEKEKKPNRMVARRSTALSPVPKSWNKNP